MATARDPVPWTKPEDLPFDPNGPLPAIGGHWRSGQNILFADGAVRFLPNTLDDAFLRAIITRDGGERIEWP